MSDRWFNQHIEIELNKPQSILDKILECGYIKVDTSLKHFDVYEKGTKKLLYRLSDKTIDMIYDTKKVFERFNRITDLEVGE